MSTFMCPEGAKHPLRFEFSGQGRKAFCMKCKRYYRLCKASVSMRLCQQVENHAGEHRNDRGQTLPGGVPATV